MLASSWSLTFAIALAQTAAQTGPDQGGDPKYLVFGLIAIAVAVAIFMVELFVPSGGILGVASVLSLVIGIGSLAFYSPILGVITAIVALLASPFFFGMVVKIWPQTPIARLLSHRSSQATLTRAASGTSVSGPDDADSDVAADGKMIVGHTGRAVTDLRPIGTCMIDGKRTDCLADGGVIRAGSVIKVVAVDGMQVKVRAGE